MQQSLAVPRPLLPLSGNHLSDPRRGPGLGAFWCPFPSARNAAWCQWPEIRAVEFCICYSSSCSAWFQPKGSVPSRARLQLGGSYRWGGRRSSALGDGGGILESSPGPRQWMPGALPRCLCRRPSLFPGALPLPDFVPVSLGAAHQRPRLPWWKRKVIINIDHCAWLQKLDWCCRARPPNGVWSMASRADMFLVRVSVLWSPDFRGTEPYFIKSLSFSRGVGSTPYFWSVCAAELLGVCLFWLLLHFVFLVVFETCLPAPILAFILPHLPHPNQ